MNLGRKGFISGSSLFEEVIRYIGIFVCPKKNQKIVKTCCLLKEAPENSEDLLSSQRGLSPFPLRLTSLDNRLLPLWKKCLCTSDFNIFVFYIFNYRFCRCTTNVLEACLWRSDFNMFASALSTPAARKQFTFLSISGLLLKEICLVCDFMNFLDVMSPWIAPCVHPVNNVCSKTFWCPWLCSRC